MIERILISTDFSPASWKATQVGMDLARLNEETRISILHIYPGELKPDPGEPEEFPPKIDLVKARMIELSRDLLERAEERINNIVLAGDVEKTMLRFIHKNDFDLIIIGINSNGFDNIPGSHALRVIEKSGTPVMVVPNSSTKDGAPKS